MPTSYVHLGYRLPLLSLLEELGQRTSEIPVLRRIWGRRAICAGLDLITHHSKIYRHRQRRMKPWRQQDVFCLVTEVLKVKCDSSVDGKQPLLCVRWTAARASPYPRQVLKANGTKDPQPSPVFALEVSQISKTEQSAGRHCSCC